MRVYIAQYDERQGADAVKTSLPAAQQVIERMAARYAREESAGAQWVNGAAWGYGRMWFYATGNPPHVWDVHGTVQEIEVS